MADQVTLTIDGVSVSVPKGTLIVDAAKRIENDIPVFCYHPKLKPVGMCRMCLVEVGRVQKDRATGEIVRDENGNPKVAFGPKLETACTTPVEEGMVVVGETSKVKDARDDVIEFLLTSHPLDCPICDKGGECPLQNLTLRHGPGSSRFIFDEKQKNDKHVPLGTPADALIYLDRERCIQCARCTRFSDEIADDHVLGFYERGRKLEIVTFSDPGFDSKFSGNTTDICPVGALTTADFRFGARPWELTPAASICNHCPVGCNVTFSTRREAKSGGAQVIKRVMPRQNEQVNEIWMCDKGRFGHHFVEAPDRLTTPLIRRDGQLVEASWDDAYTVIADKFRAAGAGLRALVGGRLANEDLYAVRATVAKLGGRTDLYSAMAGGDLATQLGVGPGTNLGSLGKGTAILVVATDLEEEAPIWWLRVKQAAERGATLIVANVRPTKTDRAARHVVRYAHGDAISTVLGMLVEGSSEYADAFMEAENGIIFFGHEGLDFHGSQALAQACANLALDSKHYGRVNNGLIGVWPAANEMGAWELGIAATGRVALSDAQAAWIVAADPLGDGQADQLAPFTVVQELFLTETAQRADVVLPAAAWAEREGSYTNGERRVQRFYPAVPAKGQSRPDCTIAAEIGDRIGLKLGKFPSQLFAEIAKGYPAFNGLSYAVISHVEKQYPDVGGADLYYGGTSYTNQQGLGAPLTSGAERGMTILPGKVDSPKHAAGLQLVPVQVLYDRGTAFACSRRMHPRVPLPYVTLNDEDARALGLTAGDEVELIVAGRAASVAARVDGRAPKGVVLMPVGLGVDAPTGPVSVEIRVKEAA
jgi:NADH-quinone oxidoreductase subunit G